MKAHRANSKIIKLTTFQTVKRGNWMITFSLTNMDSLMLFARSTLTPENTFIKYFSDEDSAISFVDFLVHHDFWNPYMESE